MKFRKSREEDGEHEVLIFASLTEAVNSTLCPRDEDSLYHNLACLHHECSECGTEKFQLSVKEKADTMVDWNRYEYVSVPDKNGKEQKKNCFSCKGNTCD